MGVWLHCHKQTIQGGFAALKGNKIIEKRPFKLIDSHFVPSKALLGASTNPLLGANILPIVAHVHARTKKQK